MESESNTGEKQNPPENSDPIPSSGHISKPTWIRRSSTNVNPIDRFLVQSQFGFVLPCAVLFWFIFFIIG